MYRALLAIINVLKVFMVCLEHFQHAAAAACAQFFPLHILYVGTQWRSWLRHCATSRNVAGSIPDGVIGIFH